MINLFEKIKKMIHYINNKLSEVGGFLLIIIVLLLSVDLITRTIGKPIQGLVTLSVLVLIATIYLGLSRCQEYNEHANIDLLPSLLPIKGKLFNILIVHLVELLVISIFLYGSINSTVESYASNEIFADVVKIPIWPAKILVSLGLLVYLVQILINLIASIINFIKGEDTEIIEDNINPNMF